MNNKTLTIVALRYRAVFLNVKREKINMNSGTTVLVAALVRCLKENGFCVSEELLHALNAVPMGRLTDIVDCVNEVMGVELNWTPLVKGWDVPTGETSSYHFLTMIANILGEGAGFKGTRLPCGHFIPEGTFPLERYNGCPFCGTPFKTADFVYKGQGSKLKELRLFTLDDMKHLFESLLTSATPLDGTQKDSLAQLLREFPLPDEVDIKMKETAMLVIKSLVEQNKDEEAVRLLKTPTDVLRYLWYEKTGYVQIIEPKTLVTHARKLYRHIWEPLDFGVDAAKEMKKKLKLKYDRKTCLRVARWMNATPMTAKQAAENMNPKRGMWVRVIRALRLGEYSRKKGFDLLAEILDVFYKQDYITWQGRVNKAFAENDADKTLALLKERPGFFARCLFSSMLRLGTDKVMAHPMKISESTGVAYDPSCVQHMVRISEGNLSKGLIFGVLDVSKREIVWLEQPFTDQTVMGADSTTVEIMLRRLKNKLKIGQLLDMKAQTQHLAVVENPDDADEVYTYEWALNPADVTKLLFIECPATC